MQHETRYFCALIIGLFIISFSQVYSQVGINTYLPDSSAVLDLSSTERGFLLPRMNAGQRRGITSRFADVGNALLVFDTRHKLFYYFDANESLDPLEPNGRWKALNPWIQRGSYRNDRNDSTVFFRGRGNVGIGLEYPGSKLGIASNLSVGEDYAALAAPDNGLIVQGAVGIGTSDPQTRLHVGGTGAIIIPSGTSGQRPALTTPGGMRYNTQTGNTEIHNGDIWKVLIPVGTILPFAGQTVPDGWLLCDGREIGRTDYPELYRALGTAWGSGNGSSTFSIPDLRGRFLRGVDNGVNRDADRGSRYENAPGGNTGDAVGSVQDEQFQSHTHDVNDPGHVHNFDDYYNRRELSDNADDRNVGSDGTTTVPNTTQNSVTGITLGNSGGNETRPDNANVNYIIKY